MAVHSDRRAHEFVERQFPCRFRSRPQRERGFPSVQSRTTTFAPVAFPRSEWKEKTAALAKPGLLFPLSRCFRRSSLASVSSNHRLLDLSRKNAAIPRGRGARRLPPLSSFNSADFSP